MGVVRDLQRFEERILLPCVDVQHIERLLNDVPRIRGDEDPTGVANVNSHGRRASPLKQQVAALEVTIMIAAILRREGERFYSQWDYASIRCRLGFDRGPRASVNHRRVAQANRAEPTRRVHEWRPPGYIRI